MDYVYDALTHRWAYPATEVVIDGEVMPDELKPDAP